MSRACFAHLEVLASGRRLYARTAATKEPDLPGFAADESIVALQTLDAHQPWDTRVFQTRSNELLLKVLSADILQTSSERDLVLSCLRTIADSLD